jgi:hemerythrin
MDVFQWHDRYNVGIDVIDLQHQCLVEIHHILEEDRAWVAEVSMRWAKL